MKDERWYAWGNSIKNDDDQSVGVAFPDRLDFDTMYSRARLMAAAPAMRDLLLALRVYAPDQIDAIMARINTPSFIDL